MDAPVFDRVLIGGEWVRAGGGTYPVIDPATEEPAGHAPECSVEQVRAAARAARDAFDRGPWPRLDGRERGRLLAEVADRFERDMAGLVELTIAETGAVRRVAEMQQVGAPEEVVDVVRMYEALGVDQLIYAPLTLTMDQQYVLESIETFGKRVLPLFDRDPVHSTTRQREAAAKAKAA